jgi:hypothetical protein
MIVTSPVTGFFKALRGRTDPFFRIETIPLRGDRRWSLRKYAPSLAQRCYPAIFWRVVVDCRRLISHR